VIGFSDFQVFFRSFYVIVVFNKIRLGLEFQNKSLPKQRQVLLESHFEKNQ
jgi:hypothetical protein